MESPPPPPPLPHGVLHRKSASIHSCKQNRRACPSRISNEHFAQTPSFHSKKHTKLQQLIDSMAPSTASRTASKKVSVMGTSVHERRLMTLLSLARKTWFHPVRKERLSQKKMQEMEALLVNFSIATNIPSTVLMAVDFRDVR